MVTVLRRLSGASMHACCGDRRDEVSGRVADQEGRLVHVRGFDQTLT